MTLVVPVLRPSSRPPLMVIGALRAVLFPSMTRDEVPLGLFWVIAVTPAPMTPVMLSIAGASVASRVSVPLMLIGPEMLIAAPAALLDKVRFAVPLMAP